MTRRSAGRRAPRKAASMPRQQSRFAGLKSLDDKTAVIAFLVFLAVVLFLLDSLADQKALSQGAAEKMAAKLVIDAKEEDGAAFVVGTTVDNGLLEEFASKDYEQLKKELGVEADFVIHFEDLNGNVVPIGNRMCIGSRSASINGVPCS